VRGGGELLGEEPLRVRIWRGRRNGERCLYSGGKKSHRKMEQRWSECVSVKSYWGGVVAGLHLYPRLLHVYSTSTSIFLKLLFLSTFLRIK
jgi:hypothetical protein